MPTPNADEAALVDGIELYVCETLRDAVSTVLGHGAQFRRRTKAPSLEYADEIVHGDMADVRGQHGAKRALEIAAAGGHNLLFVGPPGCGKTMLARRLPSILPPMTPNEALEVTKIYSVAGLLGAEPGVVRARPFRFPHHTISQVALVGGGSNVKPGEISLAHHGVLFLDELPEFGRSSIEVMRQPLEEGSVTIARAAGTFCYPARFQLVASMNPCPCGYRGTRGNECRCDDNAVAKYVGKLSGPLLDRIDVQIEIGRVPFDDMVRVEGAERSGQHDAPLLRLGRYLDATSGPCERQAPVQRPRTRPDRPRRSHDRGPRRQRRHRKRARRRGHPIPQPRAPRPRGLTNVPGTVLPFVRV